MTSKNISLESNGRGFFRKKPYLTPKQALVLFHMWKVKQPMRMTDIAKCIAHSHQTTKNQVLTLIDDGLIVKETDVVPDTDFYSLQPFFYVPDLLDVLEEPIQQILSFMVDEKEDHIVIPDGCVVENLLMLNIQAVLLLYGINYEYENV